MTEDNDISTPGTFEAISPDQPWQSFGATQNDWNDWRWQMRHAVKTAEDASRHLRLTQDEIQGIRLAEGALPFQATPYYLSLVSPQDESCPLRRQVIPSPLESVCHGGELRDPLGEDSHSPVQGIVHKYETHVLFLVTDRCASYCRHCTRRRLAGGVEHRCGTACVSGPSAPDPRRVDGAIEYIASHREIRDVLISGGDPLILSDDRLEDILRRIRAIPHVQIIRIGSRVPVFLPMRITHELAKMLRRYAPLYVVTHFNHIREVTTESEEACSRLVDSGIPMENQTVLLRGINSDASVLKALFERLLAIRVRPYYLHQLDMAEGIEHFRTPLSKGPEILRALRGHTSGLAMPHLAVDLPRGYGKVTLAPDFTDHVDGSGTWFRNWMGQICPEPYPEPSQRDCSCPGERVGRRR